MDLIILAKIVVVATSTSSSAQSLPAEIATPLGPLTGHYNVHASTGEFNGIPYANPVARFTMPTPVDVPLPPTATEFGAQCISASQAGAEQCHFINVVAPSAKAGSYVPLQPRSVPVLVFVHGGSFIEGAGSEYNATYLAARHNAVVVTLNYRLGSFGWAQPILGLANFGLYDQQEALRFLRRTSTPSPSPSSTSTAFIEAFGGDLNRLLLFGESAGAISVAMHLVSKPSEGLFTSALVESGFMSATNQDYALARGDNFTDAAGCAQGVPPRTPENRLKCLQAAPLKAILKAEGEVTPVGSDPFLVSAWGPTVDGGSGVVTDFPYKLLAEGKVISNVNVAAGSNTDEGWLFVYPEYPVFPMSSAAYTKFVTEYIANSAHGTNIPLNQSVVDAVLKVYPPKTGTFADNRATAADILADSTFVCGARIIVEGMESINGARGGNESFYLYHFAHKEAGLTIHGSELPFVFDTGSGTPAEQRLSLAMGGFWTSFAASGNPNKGQPIEWPAYAGDTNENIILDTPSADAPPGRRFATEANRRKKYCDFWSSLQPK